MNNESVTFVNFVNFISAAAESFFFCGNKVDGAEHPGKSTKVTMFTRLFLGLKAVKNLIFGAEINKRVNIIALLLTIYEIRRGFYNAICDLCELRVFEVHR